jgi:hypothetical protein
MHFFKYFVLGCGCIARISAASWPSSLLDSLVGITDERDKEEDVRVSNIWYEDVAASLEFQLPLGHHPYWTAL